jgi:iron(III) transport system ATP-binding protein
MERFGAAYPHQLSGGEQQRVALARALAPRPRVMLMDEPFSGLDNRLRDDIRDEALKLLTAEEAAVLLVTHDPEEAMRMADDIALMRAGKIVQQGPPYSIYARPADRTAAGFFSDVNVIPAQVENGQATSVFGAFAAPGLADRDQVDIVVRPQHVKIDFDRSGTPPAPTEAEGRSARATLERARFVGTESLLEFRLEDTDMPFRAKVPGVFLPQPGTHLWLRLPRDKSFVFERADKARG